MKQNYKIISVGGSIVIPKTGFNIEFLKKFRDLILSQVKSGQKFILIIGGGATARQYQTAAGSVRDLTSEELDWVGIAATVMNAQFVRTMFGDAAHEEVIMNPTKKIKSKKSIIVAAGWKPGCSTDNDAVSFAKTYKAKELINLSNIDQVYTADPQIEANAKPIDTIDWTSFRRDIIGDDYKPGMNAPFDPVASKLAQKLKLKVSILNGTNLDQVENAILGRPFFGTVIH